MKKYRVKNMGMFAKIRRLVAKADQLSQDIKREVKWHGQGASKTFNRYYPELSGAHKWIFIVGCNNSGTSLLHSMLQKTGKVSTFPYEGQRYTRTLTRADRKGYERVWSEYLQEIRMTEQSDNKIAPRLLYDWMGELELPLKQVIVEKTTANAVRMRWLSEIFPHSYFIGMVRNGYAVVEGISRKGNKTIERGARHWSLVNSVMLEDSRKLDNYIQIRYEDLVEKSANVVNDLAQFTGIDRTLLENALADNYQFTTIKGDNELPVKNLNLDSISRLSEEDKKIIQQHALTMLKYHHYEV